MDTAINGLKFISSNVIGTVMTLFLGYVAYQQLITNRNKYKLDLYNKRFEIYVSMLTFCQGVMKEDIDEGSINDYISKKESAKFLFSKDPSIYDLLNKIFKVGIKIIKYQNTKIAKIKMV